VPRVGDVPRINQNSRAISLGKHSRMPKVGDPHSSSDSSFDKAL
jgi:hypothetical protein